MLARPVSPAAGGPAGSPGPGPDMLARPVSQARPVSPAAGGPAGSPGPGPAAATRPVNGLAAARAMVTLSSTVSVRGTARKPDHEQVGLPVAGRLRLAGPGAAEYLPRRFVGWAASRSLAAKSVTGISFGLAICAAAWFSGGTAADNVRAVIALSGSYLAAWAARLLIDRPAGLAGGESTSGPASSAARPGAAHPGAAQPETANPVLLARLIGVLSAVVVCAGLAFGARVARWTSAWEFATAVLAIASVSQTVGACRGLGRAAGPGLPRGAVPVALIAVVAPVWGTRITLLVLLSWAIADLCHTLATRGPAGPAGPAGPVKSAGPVRSPQRVARCRDDGRISCWFGSLVRGNLPALPPAIAGLSATSMVVLLGMGNLPGPLALTPAVAMLLAAPGSSYRHAGRLDWLVPGLLQAAQFLYLAALGFSRGVPAPLVFALCAMIAARYVTLARSGGQPPDVTLARSGGQPPDVTPARSGGQPPDVTPAWSGGQSPGKSGSGAGSRDGLGWEGRMLVVGFGALTGATVFAYAALTAYLGVLICSEIMTICHPEGAGR